MGAILRPPLQSGWLDPLRASTPRNGMPLSPGTRLGHYDVTALFGEGGMGEVNLLIRLGSGPVKRYRSDRANT